MSPNLLLTHFTFILSAKKASWGNSRICVAVLLQLPRVINTQPSGYVVGLIGCWACSRQAETVWSWTLHEASVLSRASCAPWEEGAAAFHTLSRMHCICARLLYCVVFAVCLHTLWFSRFPVEPLQNDTGVILSLGFVSLCFIEMNVSPSSADLFEVSEFPLPTWAGLYLSSSSNTECQCNSSLKESYAWSPPDSREWQALSVSQRTFTVLSRSDSRNFNRTIHHSLSKITPAGLKHTRSY